MFAMEAAGTVVTTPANWRWIELSTTSLGLVCLIAIIVVWNVCPRSASAFPGLKYRPSQWFIFVLWNSGFFLFQVILFMEVWIHWSKYGNNLTPASFAAPSSGVTCALCTVGVPQTPSCCTYESSNAVGSWHSIALSSDISWVVLMILFSVVIQMTKQSDAASSGSPGRGRGATNISISRVEGQTTTRPRTVLGASEAVEEKEKEAVSLGPMPIASSSDIKDQPPGGIPDTAAKRRNTASSSSSALLHHYQQLAQHHRQ